MSEQSPLPTPEKGDITVNSTVIGQIVVIGHDAQIHLTLQVRGVPDQTLQFAPHDPRWQTLLQVLTAGGSRVADLVAAGVQPAIAPLSLRAEDLQPDNDFAPPLGLPAPLMHQVDQVSQEFSALDHHLQQTEQYLGGPVQAITDGQHQVNLVDLLVQQGDLALWRFRRSAVRLFAEQARLFYLALPQDPTRPELHAFQVAAKGNLEVLRGWVLWHKLRTRHQALLTPPVIQELSQGRWREVLEGWGAAQQLTGEQTQYEKAYLDAIGEPYDAQVAQANMQEAERYFAEALRRQPEQSAALVNLGALKSESAHLSCLETGTLDSTRLHEAHRLFNRARTLLEERPDPEGRLALAQCLVYEATSLPPEADLAGIRWAAQQTQQLRAALRQEDQGKIQWEMLQRNLARRDPSFVDRKKLERARDLLIGAGVGAGATTTLLLLIEHWLETLPQLLKEIEQWMQGGGNQQPLTPFQPATPQSRKATAPSSPSLGETLFVYRDHQSPVSSLAWSPDGTRIVSSGSGEKPHDPIRIWDAATGATLLRYENRMARALAWSPNGKYIVLAGWFGPNLPQKEVREAGTGKYLLLDYDRDSCSAVAWSPDSKYIASGGGYYSPLIRIWEATSGHTLLTLGTGDRTFLKSIAWSPDGKYIASLTHYSSYHPGRWADSTTVTIWKISTRNPIFKFSQAFLLREDARTTAVAWSPHGNGLAAGSSDGKVHLWDRTGQHWTYSGHAGGVTSLTFSPSGPYLAVGSADGIVHVWDVSKKSVLIRYSGHITPSDHSPDHAITVVAWSPDGQHLASASSDKTVRIWQAHCVSGRVLLT